jgi:protein tyrosine/serine phosphatase
VSLNNRSLHVQAVAFLLALFLIAPAVGHARGGAAPASGAGDLAAVHIDNFGRVSSHYFRGAEPENEEYENLARFGIKTIVDLRSDDVELEDETLAQRAGLKYVQIPMTTHEPPSPSVIEQFLQIVDAPENQPVYVHCVGGRHRTGVMTAVYRMTREGWTADRAFKEMKQYRYGPDFLHPEFKRFVYGYQPNVLVPAKVVE